MLYDTLNILCSPALYQKQDKAGQTFFVNSLLSLQLACWHLYILEKAENRELLEYSKEEKRKERSVCPVYLIHAILQCNADIAFSFS